MSAYLYMTNPETGGEQNNRHKMAQKSVFWN